MQDYERRFQSLFNEYSSLQQNHKQQTTELGVLSKVGGRPASQLQNYLGATGF